MNTKRVLIALMLFALGTRQSLADTQDDKKRSGNIETGRVLPQVAAGGAWSTDIQVMHADDEDGPVAFTIEFFGSNGQPLKMPVVGQGMTSVVAGVVQPRGTTLIRLAGGGTTLTGYAVIEDTAIIGTVMNAVLTQVVAGRPDFQASVPSLDELGNDFQFPFRNDGPYTTTLASVSRYDQTITAIARNEAGIEICRSTWNADADSHEAILLTDRLPCTNGKTGVVEFLPDRFATLIVFLFNDSGAFTTQLPYWICCRDL